MLFELHLTTEPDTDLHEWKLFWQRHNIKPLDIRLVSEDAAHPRQIMMAAVFEGDNRGALIWATDLQKSMHDDGGFTIKRSKLEVPLDKSAEFAGRLAYYEAHVKSLVEDRHFKDVRYSAEKLGWSMSYNALYTEVDGLNKVYLTKRVPGEVDYVEAGHLLSIAFGNIVTRAYKAIRMESEAVIIDTNPSLDGGWAEC
jgi:hypothetical protein